MMPAEWEGYALQSAQPNTQKPQQPHAAAFDVVPDDQWPSFGFKYDPGPGFEVRNSEYSLSETAPKRVFSVTASATKHSPAQFQV